MIESEIGQPIQGEIVYGYKDTFDPETGRYYHRYVNRVEKILKSFMETQYCVFMDEYWDNDEAHQELHELKQSEIPAYITWRNSGGGAWVMKVFGNGSDIEERPWVRRGRRWRPGDQFVTLQDGTVYETVGLLAADCDRTNDEEVYRQCIQIMKHDVAWNIPCEYLGNNLWATDEEHENWIMSRSERDAKRRNK